MSEVKVELTIATTTTGKAAELAVMGWLEIQQNGHGDGSLVSLHESHGSILATAVGLPIGVLTFEHQAGGYLWVNISYVTPAHRRCGVYRMMWNALLDQARILGVNRIRSGIDVNNIDMRAIADTLGRREVYVVSEFEFPKNPVGIDAKGDVIF